MQSYFEREGMLLAIDIGNTNIHAGVSAPGSAVGEWLDSWRMQTVARKMGDEYLVLLHTLFERSGYQFVPSAISGVALASVVPDLTQTFTQLIEKHLALTPLIVGPGTKTGIKIVTDNPREVGADRVVNAAAVNHLYGGPAIVIDFGTATTFDIVDANGDYAGGVITAGINLAHDALVNYTAKLTKVELAPPPSPIGKNTVHAMQSGLFWGYVAMMEGMVARLRADMGDPNVRIIGTGGLAPVFAQHTDCFEQIADNLTLDGLRIIYELNQ